MLIECPECQHQISDAAMSCPNCGKPNAAAKVVDPQPAIRSADAGLTTSETFEGRAHITLKQPPPAFAWAAGIVFVLCLFTPRILLTLPAVACVVLAIISIVRKERPQWVPYAVGALAIVLVLVNSSELASIQSPVAGGATQPSAVDNLSSAKIDDWNWNADPSFGGKGAVKWNVTVRNVSSRPIEHVRVDFTTYDKAGKMIATTFTYVNAIPPGQSRSENSFADYYGTEEKAQTVIAEVNFAN